MLYSLAVRCLLLSLRRNPAKFEADIRFFANFCEGLFLIRLEELVKKEGVAFHASNHSPSSITPLTINCFIINHLEYHFSKSSMVSFELLSIS